jgi:hypothetical protein
MRSQVRFLLAPLHLPRSDRERLAVSVVVVYPSSYRCRCRGMGDRELHEASELEHARYFLQGALRFPHVQRNDLGSGSGDRTSARDQLRSPDGTKPPRWRSRHTFGSTHPAVSIQHLRHIRRRCCIGLDSFLPGQCCQPQPPRRWVTTFISVSACAPGVVPAEASPLPRQ